LRRTATRSRLQQRTAGAGCRSKVAPAEVEQSGCREQEKIERETEQRLREIPGVSGVNLMTPGRPDLLVEAISAAGLADSAAKTTH